MRRTRWWLGTTAIGLIFGNTSPASAEAVLDGSTGSTAPPFSGNFDIPHTVGRLEEGNLFHSFERFHIRRGESATFTGPRGIDNVITRVTGDEASRLNGKLASTVPGADFFFLNPNGVVFGPEARLDVDGSFHVSTADELRFADGTRLNTREPTTSSFTTAAPEAFGFLGADAGTITLDGGRLDVDPRQTLSLVGGPITIGSGSTPPAKDDSALLRAEGGRLRLIAAAGDANVDLATGDVDGSSGFDVVVSSGAQVDASGPGSGEVRVFAGQLIVEQEALVLADNTGPSTSAGGIFIVAGNVEVHGGARVTADALASGDTGRVSIEAFGTVRITETGQISSSTFAAGDAGAVRIEAKRLLVTHSGSESSTGVFSQANAGSSGDGGAVTISVDNVRLQGGGVISSSTFGLGSAGPISLVADRLRIVGDGVGLRLNGIVSEAGPGETGAAGSVRVRTDQLTIRNGGWIGSDTFGSGNAGAVTVTADDLLISGDGAPGFTGIFSSPSVSDQGARATGAGGGVQVRASDLTLQDGGEISSSTFAEGDAGAVRVSADRLRIRDGSSSSTGIFSEAEEGATGAAGQVSVSARRLEMRDGGGIASSTAGPGDAGQVIVNADRIRIVRSPFAISSSTSQFATGDGGAVVIRSSVLRLRDGGQIVGVTRGEGDSGALTVQARSLFIDGGGLATGIQSDAQSGATGNAGPLLVRSGTIEIRDGGRITSDTFAFDPEGIGGNAGPVIVEADDLTIGGFGDDGFTGISSDALPSSSGDAGNVLVTVGTLRIEAGGAIQSVTDGAGDAGQVLVATDEGVIRGNIATRSSTAGAAGALVLSAPSLSIGNGAAVTSSGVGTGPAGDVILFTDSLDAKGAEITTEGQEGGRIRINATNRLVLVATKVTSNGIEAVAGDSIITVEGGTIVLNSSSVTSLTGGEVILGSGEAQLLGELTVISPDSEVAASSKLEVSGLESDVTAGLEVLPGTFLDVSGQLRESCAAQRAEQVSSFVQSGQGSVALDLDGPLPGRYAGLGGASVLNAGAPGDVVAHALWPGGCGD